MINIKTCANAQGRIAELYNRTKMRQESNQPKMIPEIGPSKEELEMQQKKGSGQPSIAQQQLEEDKQQYKSLD